MYKHPSLLFLFVVITMAGRGQSLELSTLTSGGDFMTGNYATLSWTLGELVTETVSTTDLHLTQGFQQPFNELMTYKEPETEQVTVSIYPNPAKDHVYIDITMGSRSSCYRVGIIDMTGVMVYQSALLCESYHQSIALNQFSSSLLLIRITDKSGEVLTSEKIIKLGN